MVMRKTQPTNQGFCQFGQGIVFDFQFYSASPVQQSKIQNSKLQHFPVL
jgi:hypothetical protein